VFGLLIVQLSHSFGVKQALRGGLDFSRVPSAHSNGFNLFKVTLIRFDHILRGRLEPIAREAPFKRSRTVVKVSNEILGRKESAVAYNHFTSVTSFTSTSSEKSKDVDKNLSINAKDYFPLSRIFSKWVAHKCQLLIRIANFHHFLMNRLVFKVLSRVESSKVPTFSRYTHQMKIPSNQRSRLCFSSSFPSEKDFP
jgi:hypothetical protein